MLLTLATGTMLLLLEISFWIIKDFFWEFFKIRLFYQYTRGPLHVAEIEGRTLHLEDGKIVHCSGSGGAIDGFAPLPQWQQLCWMRARRKPHRQCLCCLQSQTLPLENEHFLTTLCMLHFQSARQTIANYNPYERIICLAACGKAFYVIA